jgi:hypothetical protein
MTCSRPTTKSLCLLYILLIKHTTAKRLCLYFLCTCKTAKLTHTTFEKPLSQASHHPLKLLLYETGSFSLNLL